MADRPEILIRFPGLSPADAGEAADELRDLIRSQEGARDISVERHKPSPDTQDLGTMLQLVLGSSAVGAIAYAVASYIRSRGHRVELLTREGKLIATGDAARKLDVAATAAALNRHAALQASKQHDEPDPPVQLPADPGKLPPHE